MLDKLNYSTITEAASSLEQIAKGLDENQQKVKQIIDDLIESDFRTDQTIQPIYDSINGLLTSIKSCSENLNKYSVHLINVVLQEWEKADTAAAADIKKIIENAADNNRQIM